MSEESNSNKNSLKKIHIHTYGCQMNERDSERVAALLVKHGYEIASSEADADVIIVNTCSVREKAEDKAVGKLGLMVASRKKRPGLVVGAMGCMAQRRKEELLRKVKGLDFVVGTSRFSSIPAVLSAVAGGRGPVVDVLEDREDDVSLASHVAGSVSAFITILLGCNRRCAYCIVPDVRGPEWSRAGSDIIKEAETLVQNGVREITLLGQSVMSYGRRNDVWPEDYVSPGGYLEPLPRLLEALDSIPGLARIRFTSGHPSGCSEELARAMSELSSVCEHIHMAVQSGSDRILEMMGRGYSADDYRTAVARLRAAMPDIAITTDVIVGFPSETEDDFEKTRAFLQEMSFDNAFIFKYSPRPGTRAAQWDDNVSDEEKLRRNHVLLEDQDIRGSLINNRLVGRELELLVEGPSLRDKQRWCGRTRTNKTTIFEKPDARDDIKPGCVVSAEINRAMPQTLYGVLV